ncbi:MAG TPA: hypothetical protein VMH06_07310, partial [Thermodesulfovibrionales bacterium]|nr:hypothetical protein [Thermodesulfovibrionales bacterium]
MRSKPTGGGGRFSKKVKNMKNFNRACVVAIVFILMVVSSALATAADTGCAATLSPDLKLHVPVINAAGTFVSADLVYTPTSDGTVWFEVTDTVLTTQGSCNNAAAVSQSGTDFFLIIPNVIFNGASYWLVFQYVPTTDGTIMFEFIDGGAASPGFNFHTYGGTVFATAVGADGTVYLGGNFTQVSEATTGGGVPIDSVTGQVAANFPPVGGQAGQTVSAVAPDGSGGWYIGGMFTQAGGVARNNLAHILPDGTVDPGWAPNVPNGDAVSALVVNGGTVYVGGHFTTIGGQARNNLAAVDAVTGAVTSWDP